MPSRSSRRFLERSGLIVTQRLPQSRVAIGNLNSLKYPLSPPYPAEHSRPNEGNPPPDRGISREWPYGAT